MWEFSLFSDSEMDFSHETLLKEHYTYLIQNMESSKLINELYSKGLLDSMDMEDLQAKETETSRNEKLLSIIRRKSALDFKKLLAALSAIGQSFIVNKVLETQQYNISDGSHGNVTSLSFVFAILPIIKWVKNLKLIRSTKLSKQASAPHEQMLRWKTKHLEIWNKLLINESMTWGWFYIGLCACKEQIDECFPLRHWRDQIK